MFSKMKVIIFIFIVFCHNGYSANILGLMGCTSNSHHLWNEVIVNALANRGHTLTVASVNENSSPHPNVTYFHFEEAYNTVSDHYKDSDATFSTNGLFANSRLLHTFKILECKGIFQSMGFRETWNLNQKFDLILFDIAAGPCMYRLIQKYPNIPVIGVSAFKMDPVLFDMVGGHSYPGYIPYFLEYQDGSMNLWQRLSNAANYAFSYLYRKIIVEEVVENLARQYVPGDRPTLYSLYRRVKIALVNTHPSIDGAHPLPPNIIEIGGLHIKEPRTLPDDINAFIETSKKGAVLVSLGSNTLVETIGHKRIEALFNVIKSFPEYHFLWKIEKVDIFKDIPKNLMIRKWLPQNDILANPKTQAFFTHAGGLSMQEATWYGVPVITMPLFLDQFSNSKNAIAKGCGYEVDFENLNQKSLHKAFDKVLNDGSYKIRMQELQKKFRDRQIGPLDTALWWIEYFLRNPQAEHFSLASRDLPFFVANSYDIVLIVFVISIAFIVNFWILLKNFKNVVFKSKKKNELKKIKDSTRKKVKRS